MRCRSTPVVVKGNADRIRTTVPGHAGYLSVVVVARPWRLVNQMNFLTDGVRADRGRRVKGRSETIEGTICYPVDIRDGERKES